MSPMRITNQLQTKTSIANITDSLDRLYDLQQKAATGKKYARASENPAVTTQGMTLRSTLQHIEVYQNTMASTKTWMETTGLAMQQMVNNPLAKTQQLVLRGLDSTQGPDERRTMGVEVDGLIQQGLSIGNTQDRGRYIFAGLKTDTKPFELISTGNLVDLGLNTNAAANAAVAVNEIRANLAVTHDSSQPTQIVLGDVAGGGGVQITYDNSIPGFSTNPVLTSPNFIQAADGHSIRIYGIEVSVQNVAAATPTFLVGGKQVNTTTGSTPVTTTLENVSVRLPTDISVRGPVYPNYHRERVLFLGDNNTILREISPNEDMTVSLNGGDTFGKEVITDAGPPASQVTVSTMFDNFILQRDILKAEDYTRPHTLVSDGAGGFRFEIITASGGEPLEPDRDYLSEQYGQLQSNFEDVAEINTEVGSRLKNLTDSVERADKATLEIQALLSQNEEVNMAEAISAVLNQETVYQTVLNMVGRTSSALSLFDTLQ